MEENLNLGWNCFYEVGMPGSALVDLGSIKKSLSSFD
jgi:hypothetical protein